MRKCFSLSLVPVTLAPDDGCHKPQNETGWRPKWFFAFDSPLKIGYPPPRLSVEGLFDSLTGQFISLQYSACKSFDIIYLQSIMKTHPVFSGFCNESGGEGYPSILLPK